MINGANCPACGREPHHARRDFTADAPTRFDCACGYSWHDPPMPKVHDETCVKCGRRAPRVEYLGECTRHISRPGKPLEQVAPAESLQLTCSCGHFWFRPTLDTKPKPSPSADPMQFNVTLGALNKILSERDSAARASLDKILGEREKTLRSEVARLILQASTRWIFRP